jgi:hypothetical protein
MLTLDFHLFHSSLYKITCCSGLDVVCPSEVRVLEAWSQGSQWRGCGTFIRWAYCTESDYVTGTEPLGVDWCWAMYLVPEKMGYRRRVKLAPLWLPISPWDLSLSYTLLTTILVTMLSCSQEALHRKQADGAVQSGTFSLQNCGLKSLFSLCIIQPQVFCYSNKKQINIFDKSLKIQT